MKYIFLILNYNSYNDTIVLAKEIIAEQIEDYRIVIVDNDSPNGSINYLHKALDSYEQIDVISSPGNIGYARGNNYGLEYMAQYAPEYVCIINNDVHFKKETIVHLADIYKDHPEAGVISPLQVLPSGNYAKYTRLSSPTFISDVLSYTTFSRRKWEYRENCGYRNLQKVTIVPGAFLFVKYELFKSVGFFYDGTFLFCEERFTGRRLEDAGRNNYLVLDCTYLHEHSKTISSSVAAKRQRKYVLDGKLLYTKEYRSFPSIKCAILKMFFEIEGVNEIIKRFIKNTIGLNNSK